MAKSGGKAQLLLGSKLQFDCVRCGRCCRGWHVALSEKEVEQLRANKTPGTPDGDPVMHIDGHPYVAHRPDGACAYLDTEKSLCLLELASGHAAKPLGCRVYPLNLVTVLPGAVSCGVRFDCPAIQQGTGRPLEARRGEIMGFMAEMGFDGTLDLRPLVDLKPATIKLLADFFAETATSGDADPATGSLALMLAANNLAPLGEAFLNDGSTMRDVLPQLQKKFRDNASALLQSATPAGATDRSLFRLWLAGCLRCDEELVGKPFTSRIHRTLHLARISLGGGSLRALGSDHPDTPPPSFTPPSTAPASDVWAPWRRWMDGRLRTLQFFGRAWYGGTFFEGATALAAASALVIAAARAHVAARGEPTTTLGDVEYAVGAVDHGFGRSALHLKWHQRFLENRFLNETAYSSILASFTHTTKTTD